MMSDDMCRIHVQEVLLFVLLLFLFNLFVMLKFLQKENLSITRFLSIHDLCTKQHC